MLESLRRHWVWLRLALLFVLLVAAGVVALLVDLPSAAEMRTLVDSSGAVAPIVFVAVYALVTLAPLPKNILSALAGAVFGFAYGSLLVYLAALVGAGVAFALGRALGRDAVESLTGRRVAKVDELLTRRGLLAVIAARLVPVLPFTAINYSAGLTAIRFRDFALGTAIGIIPGTLAYVALGSFAWEPTSWRFEVAAGVLLLLTLGGLLVAWHRRRAGRPVSR